MVRALERRLKRAPRAILRLHALLAAWNDPVAIDDGVREAIEAIDPIVEISGTTVRAVLVAMRVATTERATAPRRARETQRRRAKGA